MNQWTIVKSVNVTPYQWLTSYGMQYCKCFSHTKMTKFLKKVKLKLKLEPLKSSDSIVYDISVMLCM